MHTHIGSFKTVSCEDVLLPVCSRCWAVLEIVPQTSAPGPAPSSYSSPSPSLSYSNISLEE